MDKQQIRNAQNLTLELAATARKIGDEDHGLGRRLSQASETIYTLLEELQRVTEVAERNGIEADFFKDEVKLRNRIAHTNQDAAEIQRTIENLTAKNQELCARLKAAELRTYRK